MFGKKSKINWIDDGWNTLQEANADKHILEISCRTEKGQVVEVRFRHNDGEEQNSNVTCNGEAVLPMAIKDFEKLYNKGNLKFE